jgi:hypothetical protein
MALLEESPETKTPLLLLAKYEWPLIKATLLDNHHLFFKTVYIIQDSNTMLYFIHICTPSLSFASTEEPVKAKRQRKIDNCLTRSSSTFS